MSRDFSGVRVEVEDGLDEDCFVEIQLQVPDNMAGDCNYYDNFTEYLTYQEEDPEVPPSSCGNGAVRGGGGSDVASGSRSRTRRSSRGAGGTAQDQDGNGVVTRSKRLKVGGGDKAKASGKGKDNKKMNVTVTPIPAPVTKSKLRKSSKSRSKSKMKPAEVEVPPKPVVVMKTEPEASGGGAGGGGKKASRGGKRGLKGPRGKKRKRSASEPVKLEEGPVPKVNVDNDKEGSSDSKNVEIVVLYPRGLLLDLETPQLTAPTDKDKQQVQLSVTNDDADAYANQGQLSMTNDEEDKYRGGSMGGDNENQSPESTQIVFHKMAASFRKFRSLPKAYRWMCYEFFYSDIDRALFLAKNDFEECLREYFPRLKTRYLRRAEWKQIRQVLGRPRRFSENFLSDERNYFESARNQIRRVQRRQLSLDVTRDLPDEIPLQLNIGKRVSAMVRLESPGRIAGIYRGTVDGLDPASDSYRITFDFKAIGTQSVIDYEVQSDDPPEIVSTASISMKMLRSRTPLSQINRQMSEKDTPVVASELPVNGLLGGFSVRFLEMIVRLRKLLHAKRTLIQQLRGLNSEAEKICMTGNRYPKDFLVNYSICIVSLDRLNAKAPQYFNVIEQECEKLCSSKHLNLKIINPEQVLNQCNKHGEFLVSTYNVNNDTLMSRNEKSLRLISSIASIMLQLKTLSDDANVWHACDVHSIKTTLSKIKGTLEGKNLRSFQNRIEMPINRIAAGIVHDSKQGKGVPDAYKVE